MKQSLYHDAEYEKEVFLMSDEEVEIFNNLPDKESKDEFIKEFWEKRDPTPETEENEYKDEIEKRVIYANRWFREGSRSKRGWDTDRGRIFLILGPPDQRDMGETLATRYQPPVKYEVWIYFFKRLIIRFSAPMGSNRFLMVGYPPELFNALKEAKLIYFNRNIKDNFKFDAEFDNQNVLITIPVKRITFSEDNQNLFAQFKIDVYVYHNFKKVDEISISRKLTFQKEQVLNMNEIQLKIPYLPVSKGKYFFDIFMEDSLSEARYRKIYKFKY